VDALTSEELQSYSIAPPFADLSVKGPIKFHKSPSIWLVINGTRHCFPNYDTYVKMGFGPFQSVDTDFLAQFPVGPDLPSL
jgi:hypothetical protein